MSTNLHLDVSLPKGRPRDAQKSDAILDAARTLFIELPYARVTMDKVAERAGVSKVTVYAQHSSKDQLFLTAMRAHWDQMLAEIGFSLSDDGDVAETLKALAAQFVLMITSEDISALHAVMMAEGHRRPELPRQFFERVIMSGTGQLADYLSAANRRGKLACPEPKVGATQFLAMVKGNFDARLQMGLPRASAQEVTDYVDQCVQVLMLAWKPNP